MIEDLKITREKDGRNLDTSVNGKTLLYAESEQGVYGGVSVDALKSVINSGVTDDCVKIIQQALTAVQKQQARQNIDAMPTDESVVKYSAQTLTDAEKTQARTNIGLTDAQIKGIVKSEIEKEAYFQSGESYSIEMTQVCSGYVSNSSQDLRFSYPVGKNPGKVTPAITSLKINVRGSAGTNVGYVGESAGTSYIDGGKEVVNLIYQVQRSTSRAGNFITINLTLPTKWYIGTSNSPNNYPAIVEVNSIKMSFS